MLVAEKETLYRPRTKKLKMLSELVFESIDGRDYYYRGYQEVLKGKKSKEEIMGTSGLQSLIISYLIEVIIIKINKKLYHFLTGETGLHLNQRDNLSNDIAIYDKTILTPDKITTNYIDVPPKVAIEVDIRIDLERPTDHEYVYKKTEKLLDFGLERVIWVFTNSQKVLIAEPRKDWIISDWYKEIEILEGITFNIAQFLKQEGINVVKS